jgi:hypothetical protein
MPAPRINTSAGFDGAERAGVAAAAAAAEARLRSASRLDIRLSSMETSGRYLTPDQQTLRADAN